MTLKLLLLGNFPTEVLIKSCLLIEIVQYSSIIYLFCKYLIKVIFVIVHFFTIYYI